MTLKKVKWILFLSFFCLNIYATNHPKIIHGEWQLKSGITLKGTLQDVQFTSKQRDFYRHENDSLFVITSDNDSLKNSFKLFIDSDISFRVEFDKFWYKKEEDNRFKEVEVELSDIIHVLLPLKISDDEEMTFEGEFKRMPLERTFLYSEATRMSDYRKKDVKILHLIFKDLYAGGIPKKILEFPNLQKLTLLGLREGKYPEGMDQLKNLEELEMRVYAYNKKHLTFPPEILKIPNLKKLKLEGFTSLPDNIDELEKLTSLSISHSKLGHITKNIGNLKNLEFLHLYSCMVLSIPSSIPQLTNLKELSFMGLYVKKNYPYNEMTVIPQEVWQLNNLRKMTLSLDNSCLPKNEKTIQLDSLQELDLFGNYQLFRVKMDSDYKNKFGHLVITDFPKFIFQAPSLEKFRITGCSLQSLPDELFETQELNITIEVDRTFITEEKKLLLIEQYKSCCAEEKGQLIIY